MVFNSSVRNISIKVLLLTFCFTFSFSKIFAQTTVSDTLEVKLDEIRVEAAHSAITVGKAPLSLTYNVRNSADLVSQPAATMDELTYTMPGIFISNRDNYALGERLTIRGLGWRSQFGVRGTQVLLDGMPLTVADGQTIMNMIDPAAVKRIELLRGPAGTFWGNSSGGVLFLSTEPRPDAPAFTYRGYGGSFSTVKQELELNVGQGKTRIYGYGTYYQTDGYRNHSAATLYRGSIGLERSVSNNGNFKVRVAYTGMPEAQHPGSLTKEDSQETPRSATPRFVETKAGKTIDQAMVGTSYIHQFGSGILDVSAHGTYRDVQNPLTFGVINLERYASGIRPTFQFRELPFDLQIGGELKIQDDDRLETNNVNGEPGPEVRLEQKEQVINQALFSSITVPFGERFSLSAGARADWLSYETPNSLDNEAKGSRSFFSVNPSLGFIYELNRSTLFANLSTSFESPTTTELVNRPSGGPGFNQSIEPEKTVSIETGLRGRTNKLSYDFAVYGMNVEDILVPIELQDGPVYFTNQGKTNHYGIEIGLTYDTTEMIDFRVMLNYLQAKFDGGNYDGNDLPGVSPFRAGGVLNFKPGKHQFSFDSEWIGSYYADSENSAKNSAYALLHFRWTVQIAQLFDGGNIRPFVSVNNLFNERYNSSVFVNAFGNRFFEPGSDRNFKLGIQIELN